MFDRMGFAAGCLLAAGALTVCVPTAHADNPSCDQQPPDQQQQCQQQQGPGVPQLPQNRDPGNGNPQPPQQPDQPPQQPPQAPQNNPQQNGIDLSDKNCWVINGVPVMWNPALATGPGDVVGWCPQVYGLQPH